ncbi:MAG: chemotaxis protein [Lachnospiraceae bacterium]|nr:chemotaxis protein [Lachnospiraceae bacterium]
MARKKKQEEASQGSPAWMATFSDLMNLLLCFFVLLFSMSTIDAEKFEALLASLSGDFSVFQAGSSMVGEDIYVASGATQMVEISQYFTEFTDSGGKDDFKEFQSPEDYEAQYIKEQQEKTESLYDEIVEKTEQENLDGSLTVEADKNNNCVRITIGGAVLFNSGDSELKKEALPIMSRVSDILKSYKDNLIKIEGHTDNVPISGNKYKSNMSLSMARAESVFDFLVEKKKMNPIRLEPSGKGEYVPVADNSSSAGRAKNRRVEFRIYTD